ncbi:MAG: sugar phosphate isomerase/epimerase family protein [Armatimonadota bacterium]|nr:sugar phosphate isomerase/epimerase [Armatimonadota bacterium]MDW8025055.1 sugar phosphate isomerase/epimerase family protein [Armatimonadota bacterium]
MRYIARRNFIGGMIAACGAGLWGALGVSQGGQAKAEVRRMRLGLVTYNLAKDWDLPTILKNCREAKFEGVELRTTHRHGVEPDISQQRRIEVRRMFEDSGIVLWGLGTVCEFHSPEQDEVRRNIEVCKAFVVLARDIGAKGVKVRPNAIPRGVPVEKTLEQIGRALTECGRFAADHGVEIWLEVHGQGTSHPPHIRKIMEHCEAQNVGVCWNSNSTDIKDGSVKEYFELLRPYIKSVHINELWREDYPWRELFTLLKAAGYDRFTLAEIPESPDALRLMRYYRALWLELTR